jgi:pimeloyl-ACP methyl ester carboxylesterase
MATVAIRPERTVDSFDGVPIHYTVQGEGAPALIFVHGWACNKNHWADQVSYFSPSYRVVTIDLAGHGASGRGREAWTMTNFGRDVQAVVDILGLDQVVLLGHSMGGAVILEAAHLMPERVAGLVGVDTFTYEGIYPWVEPNQIREAMAPFEANFVETTQKLVHNLFPANSDPALVARVAAEMSAIPPEIGLPALEALFAWDLVAALKQVQAPLCCLNAKEFLSEAARQRYAAYFEIIPVAGVGHFLMMENPPGFNRLLAEAIEKLIH